MSIHGDIAGIIRNELDDCERALKKGEVKKALRELDDAVTKLKDIERRVNVLERR
jgi:hypothetical protein